MLETRLDLLRHGQCEGGEIFRGRTDVVLTDEGWNAMTEQLTAYGARPWQRVISSPLRRCQNFARFTAEQLQLPLHIEPDLQEIHFGQWEGRSFAELWEEDPRMRLWVEDPERYSPTGGEALVDFGERVERVLSRLLQDYAGQHLLIVTHGGVIRLLLTQVWSLPRNQLREMSVPYAHFVGLRSAGGRLLLDHGFDPLA